jgi:hypothetical protein
LPPDRTLRPNLKPYRRVIDATENRAAPALPNCGFNRRVNEAG